MIIIEGVLIADEVLEELFACDLGACKGACCVQGESGAPLEADELPVLEQIYPSIKPYLTQAGRAAIQAQGFFVEEEDGSYTTPLIGAGGPCAYINYENGVAICGIEKAFRAGAVAFQKPVSCHLYPVRVVQQQQFELLYYHQWGICAPACRKGQRLGMPVFRFVKDALMRKYGTEFYTQLEELYQTRQRNDAPTAG
jgi:hypothetical protein